MDAGLLRSLWIEEGGHGGVHSMPNPYGSKQRSTTCSPTTATCVCADGVCLCVFRVSNVETC